MPHHNISAAPQYPHNCLKSDFTHIKENDIRFADQWQEMIDEMRSDERPILKIHQSIYDRFLEILPPVYQKREV